MLSRAVGQILRILILYLLLLGYYLYLSELVSLPLWSLFFIGAAAAGWGLATLKCPRVLRFPAAFLLFILLMALLRTGTALLARWELVSPHRLLALDSSLIPLALPLALVFSLTFFSRRHPRFPRWEAVIHGVLLTGLLWSQGRYGITVFPHPSFLALAAALVVILDVTLLLVYSGVQDRRRSLLFWFLSLILLYGVGTLFLSRYAQGAVSQGGGLVKPTLLRFDFSKYVKLESEISMNNQLVLLYGTEAPPMDMLLRRYVLSGYSGDRGFFLDTDWEDLPVLPPGRRQYEDPGYLGREETWQEYYLVNFDPDSLVALNYPVEVVPLRNWGDSSFLRNYRVRSMTAPFLGWELEEAAPPQMEPEDFAHYTEYGEDDRIRELALQAAGEAELTYDMAMGILLYLQDNYYYSLKPGVALDGNQLHHFLFQSRKGYCSYFAFAMTLMCRSLDIPSRVAVGFFVDPSLGVMNLYPVRSDMAHAWVEVYFEDYGWITFDPTSQTMAPGEEFEMAGLEMEQFLLLIEEILSHRDGAEEADEEEPAVPELSLGRRLVQGLKAAVRFWWMGLLLAWGLTAAAYHAVPAIRIVTARDARREADLRFRRYRKGFPKGPVNQSVSEWARSREAAGPAGVSRPAASVVRLYLKARFSPVFSERDLMVLRALIRRDRRSLRRETSLLLRLVTILFPWRKR